VVLSLVSLIAAAACLDTTSPGNGGNTQIRIMNASGQALNLFLDNRLAVDQSVQTNLSLIITRPGPHTLTFRTANGDETNLPLLTTPRGFTTTYAYTDDQGVVVGVILDSAATPATDKAKVRFTNLSRLAPSVDAYVSQPAGAAGTLAMAALPYLSSSSFVEMDAAELEVYVTDVGAPDKLQSTTFEADGASRWTVFLVDSADVPVFRIAPN
jgi:hypothetical protein